MKLKLFLLFCVFSFVACSDSDPDTPVIDDPVIDDPDPVIGEWKIIFEENFDANFAKWNIWQAGAFNNEVQLYDDSQLNIDDGILTITAQREAVEGPANPFDATPKNFEYTSGRVETKTLFGPRNANGKRELRIMARIKMPTGAGMWPAFWSYGDPWPTKGEIDIIEARGNESNTFLSNIFYGTMANQVLTSDTEKIHTVDVDIREDYHVYELIWKQNSLEIKFDDTLLHTYNANSKNYVASLFGKGQQVVLNVAVGGNFIPIKDTSTYADTAMMQVDWVKVYER